MEKNKVISTNTKNSKKKIIEYSKNNHNNMYTYKRKLEFK
jgi:hypothetical protein